MAKVRARVAQTARTERVRLVAAFAFAGLSFVLAAGLAFTQDDFARVDSQVQNINTLDRIDRLQEDLRQRTTDEQLAMRAFVDGAPASSLIVYNHDRQRILDDSVALRLAALEVPALHDAVASYLNSRSLVETFVNNQIALASGHRIVEAKSLAPQGRILNEAFTRAQVRLDTAIEDLKNQARDDIARLLSIGRMLAAGAAFANFIAAAAIAVLAYEYTRFRKVAELDEITGLHNRRYFERHAAGAARSAQRGSATFALLYLDLDGFKRVNDLYGHRAGDELLRAVGRRIADNVSDNDIVARLGGDEFGVVLQNASESQAAAIAQRLSGVLAQPYALRRRTVTVGCSLGFSMYPNDGISAPELVQAADHAMYRVKRGKIAVADIAPEPDADPTLTP